MSSATFSRSSWALASCFAMEFCISALLICMLAGLLLRMRCHGATNLTEARTGKWRFVFHAPAGHSGCAALCLATLSAHWTRTAMKSI